MTSRPGKLKASQELRQSFLDFFAQHDHRILASSSLKPADATTLFTSAGMQQFVPWFRGIVPAAHPRVATCQKCFRADDIEHVGRTPRHLTFFEMLGNFSFGDYFKRGAIELAWEYVSNVLQLPKHRLWITTHFEDDESPGLWRQIAEIPEGRILPDPTNWWGPVGKSGPCGPCTEIHVDLGEDKGCGRPECDPLCEELSPHNGRPVCGRFSEVWNLVFQTYHKTEEGELQPLPSPGIDTGMGLERVAAVLQGAPTVFETDLLAPIIRAVRGVAPSGGHGLARGLAPGNARPTEETTLAIRIIADHVRALAFLLADGFTPSNDGAGYVLRRVVRRAYRFGRMLRVEEPFLYTLVPSVVETMGGVYPELVTAQTRITTWVEQEEKQFEDTLARSYGPLTDAIERTKAAGLKVLPGEELFRLYDTYGLPSDLAAETAAESGLGVDEEGFARAMDEQRTRARARAEQDFASALRSGYQGFVGKTQFRGYESLAAKAVVIGIVRDGAPVESLAAGEQGEVFLDETSFYAESGGQVGDTGLLTWAGGSASVRDTFHPVDDAYAHRVVMREGTLAVGQRVSGAVDELRRKAIERAHTATHLLHLALRLELGEHAVQSGSRVEADRLRFDFAHFSALTAEQMRRVENLVLGWSLVNVPMIEKEMPLEEARAAGATALFGEKYGETVRVVEMVLDSDHSSRELCGGTHADHTSAIGGFAIISEGSIGAGLRRIEAVTGKEAHTFAVRQRDLLHGVAQSLGAKPEDVAARIEILKAELRRAEREIARMQQRSAGALANDLVGQVVEVGGVKVLAARVERLGAEALRQLADQMLTRIGSGTVVLGCEIEGRAHFVAEVSKDLVERGYHAGNLVREVAKIAGGGGGGRPDFAQAGGKSPERLEEALAKVRDLVAAQAK